MCKFSIIIPAYNAEEYIGRCLQSILAQNYDNYEVIVINDGSTDNTKEKVEYFNKVSKNIKVLNKVNSGVSDSRNIGLDESSGEYILFMDADDYILNGYLEFLDIYISKKNIDCVMFNYTIDSFGKHIVKKQTKEETVVDNISVINYFVSGRVSNAVWNKVFSRTVLKNIRFESGVSVGEDGLFCLEALLKCRKVHFKEETFYMYMQDTGGVTKGGCSTKKITDIFLVIKKMRVLLYAAKFSEQHISLMTFTQILPYIFNKDFKKMTSVKDLDLLLEIMRNLSVKGIPGIKRKVIFIVLRAYILFLSGKD